MFTGFLHQFLTLNTFPRRWDGPVAVSYSANVIAKGHLDCQECIYAKNIRPWDQKDFLFKRYGVDESLAY
ncbi:MAG: hypothetical protein F4X56_03405 [Gammaproteobacteria bacterium]|nr:hypothetical protein [Gammaproteobacteria bacterium]MYC24948.1 hypothetical protein [Gammaproteobacteria bacterium]